MWTQFWDMHGGGGLKEAPFHYIYIEAPQEEAKIVFFNRFGHNPERVTCACCGEDYSLDSNESLAQLTGYHRNCRTLETPRDPETGLYKNDDPILKAGLYLEDDQEAPEGYGLSKWARHGEYQTLEQYIAREDVLVIYAAEITAEERTGEIPTQGWVYVG